MTVLNIGDELQNKAAVWIAGAIAWLEKMIGIRTQENILYSDDVMR
ncbi:MAG: hypothetical protein PUP46_08700 [Endozoicomonas sp. (ex Botrylloides leachii)]|nr:hypothetical protein [Endozoicomonas sp. (ex Botrylloides leachii)]